MLEGEQQKILGVFFKCSLVAFEASSFPTVEMEDLELKLKGKQFNGTVGFSI